MGPIGLLKALGLLAAISAAVAWVFARCWKSPSRARGLAQNLALMGLSLGWLLFACEIALFFFGARSTDFGATLAYHRWNALYWKPVNAAGFRDIEHTAASLAGKKLLVVVGDSFAVGHGIENAEARFSNRLGKRLGPQWVVANVARRGWNTLQELQALEEYPHTPHAVLLSYFINDIEGGPCEVPGWAPHLPASWLLERSYTLNALYWRLYRTRIADRGGAYLDALARCYETPEIFRAHGETLSRFVAAARARGAAVGAVVFPHLVATERTAPYASEVARLLETQGVFTLDLAPLVAVRPPGALAVSASDSHPNEALHAEAAERLYEGWARGF